jgi:iron complex outermembrane receptor protein
MKIVAKPSVALLAAAVASPLAYSQALEEVVVTARKRAETLEESPVSVRAFTSDEIASAGIETPRDFVNLTPNVTLVETQNAGNAFINVRGISQARNSEMSVAVLVDGVLMPNPAQFTQQLIDVQQIEVLRGPQGALYGRNAIGGAITIVTKKPGDEVEGSVEVGGDSGPGYTLRGMISGPLNESGTLTGRVAASYVDTDGYIDNEYLDEEADPYEDFTARARLIWEPSDNFSADLRLSTSQLDTQALYFTIDQEADDTDLDVRVNNPGKNEREIYNYSLKLEWNGDWGTVTAITAYDDLEELLTGDQFNFLPREESVINFFPIADDIRNLTGDPVADLSQTQYLESDSWSQEIRFISPAENRLRWIAGAYAISTDRYISTGNQVDRGFGVFDVRKTPRVSLYVDPTDPSPQLSLLADEQDNFAWAVFGEIAYDFTEAWEASFSLRYDEDERENTTLTRPEYDPTVAVGGIGITYGEKRKETWDEWQPKLTVRYKPNDDTTVYGGYSRGFRSGGFNQSGVGAAVPEPGIDDLFDAQVADTYEVGVKSIYGGGRFATSVSVYYTDFDNAYFFFFDPGTSTQNLGTVPNVEYIGFELEGKASITESLTGYYGFGYTDGEIQDAADPADEGNQAPLVTEYTVNLGGEWRIPVDFFGANTETFVRVDYQRLGDTWWDPGNLSKRSPVDLVDMRIGLEAVDDWSFTLWAKNLFDEEYNAEFSPGPFDGANGSFLWPAQPLRWGATFTKKF